MAAEAEAAREARAKVIAAEGEQKASRALKEAAEVITQSPAALQLRYLQTLNTISAEKNSTIIFPLPIDFIGQFINNRHWWSNLDTETLDTRMDIICGNWDAIEKRVGAKEEVLGENEGRWGANERR